MIKASIGGQIIIFVYDFIRNMTRELLRLNTNCEAIYIVNGREYCRFYRTLYKFCILLLILSYINWSRPDQYETYSIKY